MTTLAEPQLPAVCCGNCAAFRPVKGENGECHFAPPTPFLVGAQANPASALAMPGRAQQAVPVFMAAFPPVHKRSDCLCFRPIRAETALDERSMDDL